MIAAALLLTLSGPGGATKPPAAAPGEVSVPLRRYQRTEWTGAIVLGSWAVANISTGIAGAVLRDDERRFFHQMNAMWNTVNLGLALASIVRLARPKTIPRTARELERASEKKRRVYLVNGALDVLYVCAGAVTAALGHRFANARAREYGASIAMQGLVLFAFDVAMVLAHERALGSPARARRVPNLE